MNTLLRSEDIKPDFAELKARWAKMLIKYFLSEGVLDPKFTVEVESGKHTLTFDIVNNESTVTIFNTVINKFKCDTNNLMLKNCRFISTSGEINTINNFPCMLHKSGRFEFEFESPFAYWALEEL